MRVVTLVGLALAVALVMSMHCCEGAMMRSISLNDEEEEFRPRRLYRDYALMRSRDTRADDSFDDYGHMRFGRSDD
ncbi:unnamed protein product, partial [Iphiclides podalirius]